MKSKLILTAALIGFLGYLLISPADVLAGREGPAGKSKSAHLYLYEKDPVTWEIISGAWAKMRYRMEGPLFRFTFNGHKMVPGTDYTLIYYPDPWPGTGLVCIESGIANGGGNIHLGGKIELNTDLPASFDLNYPAGAKIWLVLTADVDCTGRAMIGWNPAEYLFENSLILYNDTDL